MHRGFFVTFGRFLRTLYLQNTSEWLSIFATVAGFILCNYIERRLSSSEKSLVRKKIIHISQVFYRFRIFFPFSFFHFLWQMMPVYLVSCARRMLYSEQPTVLLAWRHLNNNFGQFRTFSKKHNFLVLTDPVVIRIYLRTAGEGRQMLKTC